MLSRAYQNQSLPRWAYLALAAACICMGLWCSYITLAYFEHGAKALETDVALQALAVAASVMFVASEMGAFTMAAVLTERQLKARRWLLIGFAAAVLGLEVWTIVAVQMALTSGADLTQTTVQTQEKDLRARIALIEADAAAKRATAEQQRTTAKTAYELHLAGKSSDKAAAEQAKTAALYDELKTVQAQKRPTLGALMGERTALSYAVYRGVLVSFGGLVFFGTAGALLRAARGGVSIEVRTLEILERLDGAIGAPVEPAPAPAPALALATGAPADTDAPAPGPLTVRRRGELGRLLVRRGGAPKSAHTPDPTAPESAHAGATTAPKSVQRKARKPAGAQLDTGTSGNAATRYQRIKAAVQAGTLKPSVRALQAAEGGGGDVVRAYLHQLETEGVTVRAGRGWVLAGCAK